MVVAWLGQLMAGAHALATPGHTRMLRQVAHLAECRPQNSATLIVRYVALRHNGERAAGACKPVRLPAALRRLAGSERSGNSCKRLSQ